MTVSFQTSMVDSWHQVSHLITRTVIGRCFLVFVLVTPVASAALTIYKTVPGSKAEHLMMRLFWPTVAGEYLIFAFAGTLGLLLGSAILPTATITIEREFCHRKELVNSKSRWRAFASLTEEPEYYFFTGWRYAFCIPKSAFQSRAEADAFYQIALQFWREARGLPEPPIPDTTGVWPPAPRPSNSAEPGDSRKC